MINKEKVQNLNLNLNQKEKPRKEKPKILDKNHNVINNEKMILDA